MISRITLCTRHVLPLWIICCLTPAVGAQPFLWGTAAADGTHPNGRLLRIDYLTGSVLSTFNGPAGVVIGDGFSGVAIRPSNGQVFITDGLGSNIVFRIDPNTGAVLGSFPSPTISSTIDALEFVSDELYASTYAGSNIVRINPDTGALIGTLPISLGTTTEGGLALVNGALYSRGSVNSTTITRRDLATGAVLGEFATPNSEIVRGLASDDTSLYAASSAGIIYRLDPATGNVLDSRNIGIVLDGLGGPVTAIPEPAVALLIPTVAVGFLVWSRARAKRLQEQMLVTAEPGT